MNRFPLKLTVALLGVSLLVASCVSIAGQRISWFHDQAKDTLKILIHYDGIHEGRSSPKDSKAQLKKFLADGDILLLDWWGHLELGPIREKIKTGNLAEKMLAKTLTSFQSRAAGHYHDVGGRIGALQVVTIPKVSRFLKKLNEIVNAAVMLGKVKPSGLPKTENYWKEAARDRHSWVALDGHAIRVVVPVHPDEAGRFKARYVSKLVSRALFRSTDEHKDLVRRVGSQIANIPLSFQQDEDEFTITLGLKSRPTTLRITTRDEYNKNMVEAVKNNVPTDLDMQLGMAMLQRAAAKQRGEEPQAVPGLLGDLLEFGPPEDRVGALVYLGRKAGRGWSFPNRTPKSTQKLALAALKEFGAIWAKRGLLPTPPPEDGDQNIDLDSWSQWYVAMTGRAPLEGN